MKAIAFSAIRGYPRYHSLMSTNSLQQNLFTSDEYGAAKVRDALNRCTLKISQRYPISTADATFYEFLEVMNDAVSISLISLMPTNKSFSSIYSCLEIRAIEVRKSRCINWCGIFRKVTYWEILQNGEIMCHFWNLVAKASAPGGVQLNFLPVFPLIFPHLERCRKQEELSSQDEGFMVVFRSILCDLCCNYSYIMS